MSQMIFINLPVTDLQKSVAFYEALGAQKDERFADDSAVGVGISETIKLMLLTHERFATFTPKTIPDARSHAQVLLCLSKDSRQAVDEAVDKAVTAGGSADPTPKQDHGFMYGRSYEDPDGHVWEVMWMDVAEMEKAMAAN